MEEGAIYLLALASPLSLVHQSLLHKHHLPHNLGLCDPFLQEDAGEAGDSVGPVCPVHRHGQAESMGASWPVVAAVVEWALGL